MFFNNKIKMHNCNKNVEIINNGDLNNRCSPNVSAMIAKILALVNYLREKSRHFFKLVLFDAKINFSKFYFLQN